MLDIRHQVLHSTPMATNTQSHGYQKRVRKLTRMIKDLHPLMSKISAPLPTLNSEANRISPKLSAKDATARKEEFGKREAKHLDKAAIAYWLKTDDTYKSNRG